MWPQGLSVQARVLEITSDWPRGPLAQDYSQITWRPSLSHSEIKQ
jgi:hypothetical protein